MNGADPSAMPAKYSLLPSGHRIAGRYQIVSMIGEGAQGVVYLAAREPEGDRVALKVLHRHLCGDAQIFKRFHREAQILKRLEGEHLVRLFDFIEEDGLLIIALEYIEGTSLEDRLKEKCPLEIKEAVEIALQVCAALGAAHAAGVVHRDLKPANVLLEQPGHTAGARAESPPSAPSDVRVRVVDFGVAKVLQGGPQMVTSLTEQGMIFGTAEYMAPEQARGDAADARSDLYAAGVMLYEMAVGKVPFKGWSSLAVMTAQIKEEPLAPRFARPRGEISATLDAVILRALSKDPADRYPDARTFAQALAATRDEQRFIAGPPLTGSAELLATLDTELHLNSAAIAAAKTVPAGEVPEMLREMIRNAADSGGAEGSAVAKDVSATDTRIGQPITLLTPEIPSGRSGWLWAVIAIIAAAVGVVIGAVVGSAR
jgi:serine/threonine protein kinase